MQYTDMVSSGNTNLDIPQIFPVCDNMPMGYLDQLANLRKSKGFTQASLAERLGVEQPTVQRWEKGKREPNLTQLIDLANVLGVEPAMLIDPTLMLSVGARLYVKGEVAAGVWRPAFESPQDEWQSFTGRADVVADVNHRFGLRVMGDSMNEIYPPGTIVECVSTFGHAEPVPGKRVIVVRTNHDNEVEATVKELVEQDGALWLVPRSTNPAHQPFRVDQVDDDIREVRIAAVVVSSVRPE